MAFKPFQTHVGLLIHVAEEGEDDNKRYIATLTGNVIKELLNTPDAAAAERYAENLQRHYEERKLAETPSA